MNVNVTPICFVHIGKTGGNSINDLLSNKRIIINDNSMCQKQNKTLIDINKIDSSYMFELL